MTPYSCEGGVICRLNVTPLLLTTTFLWPELQARALCSLEVSYLSPQRDYLLQKDCYALPKRDSDFYWSKPPKRGYLKFNPVSSRLNVAQCVALMFCTA